ncbi:MAG: arylsulfatase [Steroidobacteraceae bacterium]|jgi:arylsulfatase|nr:arylsulfatase [Steroidobacteraceae bacterium]
MERLSRRELLQTMAGGAVAGGASGRADGDPRAAPSPTAPAGAAAAATRRGAGPGRPDIALVVLDDVGYADLGCFGSEIETPAIDRLARRGVALANFHVTALCTPTRACLLTGRNAHRVGAGTIAEWARDQPGYRGVIAPDVPTLPEMLRELGYSSVAIGKWHLAPVAAANASGPFGQWPTGRGFDKWYGFHGPVADHWHPELWEGTVPVAPPRGNGYHLTEDLVEHAIGYLRDHVAAAPDRPLFTYLALGACHWPLHAPPGHVARQRGRYDAGWDSVRAGRFARQVALGLLPEGTRLAPGNPGVPSWSSLGAQEQRFAARVQEVYAGFLSHADEQVGRFVAALEALGRLERTVLLVLSDNGASREGGRLGASDLRRSQYVGVQPLPELLAAIDELGSSTTWPAYAQGWAQASNTPLKWYKSTTFGGGTRAPLIWHWPAAGLGAGGLRRQYHHAIDIVPTLLEIAGAPPSAAGGPSRVPLQGVSMTYALRDATAATRKRVQHYETTGDRAIWADGWKAVTRHLPDRPFDSDVWELYDTTADFSELEDRAAAEPRRLAALQELWSREADANAVLPLDSRTVHFFAANVQPPRPEYVFFPGMARLDRLSCPDVARFDHEIEAAVDVPTAQARGVLLAFGTSLAGYELSIEDGYLVYDYAGARDELTTIRASRRIPAGPSRLRMSMRRHGAAGAGADVSLWVDSAQVGSGVVPRLWPLYSAGAGMRCGLNAGAPIAGRHPPPNRFDGILLKVTVRLALPAGATPS